MSDKRPIFCSNSHGGERHMEQVLSRRFHKHGSVFLALRLLRRPAPRKDIVSGVIARVPRGTRDGNLERLRIRNRI